MAKPFDITSFKESVRERRETLLADFRAGNLAARDYTRALSDAADGDVRKIADHFLGKYRDTVTLVLTGGNGRQEVYPGADLDILMLLPEEMKETVPPDFEEAQSNFVTALWDVGYEPGTLVHTPEQSLALASKDQTVWTTLLDRRKLWGSETLYSDLSQKVEDLNASRWQDFLDEKLAERDKRYGKTSDTRYVVQPNVKEGKGGLRDFHTMMWISHVVFGCKTIDDLAEQGLLSNMEARQVRQAYDCLMEARCHLRASNAGNSLTAATQPDIAEKVLRFEPHERQQAIEDYMRLYFLHARDVGFLTNVVSSAALEKKAGFGAPVRSVDNFTIRNDKVRFSVNNPAPLEMMRIFEVAQDQNAEVHPDALRAISRNKESFDEHAQQDPEGNQAFMRIITAPKEVGATLRRMQETGMLSKFLPPMHGIDMLVQFDPYHAYTVDEHTFQAMDVLNRLREDDDKAKIASDIAGELDDSDRKIMAVAMLLHDSGKDGVETGDEDLHPVRGAEMVRQYGPRLGLNRQETERAAWLVENHLVLAHTALRRDLNDPWTVETFARKIGSEKNLELLTLLTTADIMGNNPDAWEPNVAVRIGNLFHRTKAHMRKKDFVPEPQAMTDDDAERTTVTLHEDFTRNATVFEVTTPQNIRVFERLTVVMASNDVNIVGMDYEAHEEKQSARSTVIVQGTAGGVLGDKRAEEIRQKVIQGLDDDEVLNMSVQDKRGYKTTKKIPYRFRPEVELSNDFSGQSTVIEITAPDRPSLLNNVAKVFNELGLELKHARVSTYGKSVKAQDTFYVVDRETREQIDPERFDQIRTALLESPALSSME